MCVHGLRGERWVVVAFCGPQDFWPGANACTTAQRALLQGRNALKLTSNREGAAGAAVTGTATGVVACTLTPLMGASVAIGAWVFSSALARTTTLLTRLLANVGRAVATALRDSMETAIVVGLGVERTFAKRIC